MSNERNIDPAETYVLDDDEVAELDDLALTGVVKGLTEYVDDDDGSGESEESD